MNWTDFVVSDPAILRGKPTVRGTRLSVEFILGLFAEGWTQDRVLENYPALTPDSLRAVFAYAAQRVAEENLVPVRPAS